MNNEEKILALLNEINNRLGNVEGQLEENTNILRALEHRVKENSAKIEGLSIGMVKEFGSVRAENNKRFSGFEENMLQMQEFDQEVAGLCGEHEIYIRMMRKKFAS